MLFYRATGGMGYCVLYNRAWLLRFFGFCVGSLRSSGFILGTYISTVPID